MPFVVLCASCEYSPEGIADEGRIACKPVHRREFATRAEAETYARDIWLSPTIWGRPRRSPQDVIRVVEFAPADAASLAHVLRDLTEDARLQEQLKHVHEAWIGGKNPYAVTLTEARAYSGTDAVAILEGDDGGQTYVVCPVALIRCDEATLKRLLLDIDAAEWSDASAVQLAFFRAAVGEHVGGGMGGGVVTGGIWVHQTLRQRELEPQIVGVLTGERPTIG